jgi:hypothetical protein
MRYVDFDRMDRIMAKAHKLTPFELEFMEMLNGMKVKQVQPKHREFLETLDAKYSKE